MTNIKAYFLSVAAAAILCAIIKQLTAEKGTTCKILRVITGVFMAITLLSPFVHFRMQDIENYISYFHLDAAAATDSGIQMANDELERIIKQQTEAYILDEASRFGIDMKVEVKLSDSDPPVPHSVMIQGVASPYQKMKIRHYISDQLGIAQENQQWN